MTASGDGVFVVWWRRYSIYLDKVADRGLGVFYKPERGFFTVDCETRQYGDPPAGFIYSQEPCENRALAFGGSFFLNAFLHRNGMMELIDSRPFGSKDSLRALVQFYIISPMPAAMPDRGTMPESQGFP